VHLVVEDAQTVRHHLEERLQERGIQLYRMEEIAPSLEDVFIALVHAEGGAAAG
jgi:hypothetical protein